LSDGPTKEEVFKMLVDTKVQFLMESNHMILILPETASIASGAGMIAMQALASLPRRTPTSMAYTKAVVVGHALGTDGKEGITLGKDVCDQHLVDMKASMWFRDEMPTKVGKLAILHPGNDPDCCHEHVNPTLERQMPFLSQLFYETDADSKETRTIDGNILPIMIQKQSLAVGNNLGLALKRLITGDGPWKNERVLFIFGSDMSHNLPREQALPRDKETVQKAVSSGFGPLLNYIKELQKSDAGSGAAVKTAAPFGYAPFLAAVKMASDLEYTGSMVRLTNSGEFEGNTLTNMLEPVRGYASIAFGIDTRTKGQIISAGPPENKYPEETTTTTTTTGQQYPVSSDVLADPNYKGGGTSAPAAAAGPFSGGLLQQNKSAAVAARKLRRLGSPRLSK